FRKTELPLLRKKKRLEENRMLFSFGHIGSLIYHPLDSLALGPKNPRLWRVSSNILSTSWFTGWWKKSRFRVSSDRSPSSFKRNRAAKTCRCVFPGETRAAESDSNTNRRRLFVLAASFAINKWESTRMGGGAPDFFSRA